MRWIKKGLLFMLIAVVLLVAIGFLLPASVHIERSVVINAAPSVVFSHVNSLRRFNAWSPWAKIDPTTQYVFSGPESGIGAKMTWTSTHRQVGKGSQEIIESRADEFVKVALKFDEMGSPFASYILRPEGQATRVTWSFDEDFGYNILARYFGLIFEKFIGPDYEAGLRNLKSMVENSPPS